MGNLFSALFGHPDTLAPTPPTIVVSTPVPTAAPYTPIVTAAAPTAWAPSNPTYTNLRASGYANVCLTSGGAMATCDATPSQKWYLDPTGLLVNQDGTCMQVSSQAVKATLSQGVCDPTNINQQWSAPTPGALVLKSQPGMSLDVPGGNATLGAPASTWTVNNLPPQTWNFL